MSTFLVLKKFSKQDKFKKYVRDVFAELKELEGITFEEIINWLWLPMNDEDVVTEYNALDQKPIKRIYDFSWPCSIVMFRNRFSIHSWQSKKLVDITHYEKLSKLNINPYVGSGRLFDVFDFVRCLSENFVGTYAIFKDILNEGGIDLK